MANNFYDKVYYRENAAPGTVSKAAAEAGVRKITFYRSFIPPEAQGRLLDIGCGRGEFLESLKSSSPLDLWGIDISEIATNQARQRVAKPDQVICANADPLPFEDNKFDIVTAWGVIEHFYSIESILREISRALKEDGMAIIMVPNVYYYKFLWDTLRKGSGPVKHQEPEVLLAFQEWKQLIEDNGLRVERTERHNKFNKPKAHWLRQMIPFYLSNHFIYICRKQINTFSRSDRRKRK